jgi:hypothetical protein
MRLVSSFFASLISCLLLNERPIGVREMLQRLLQTASREGSVVTTVFCSASEATYQNSETVFSTQPCIRGIKQEFDSALTCLEKNKQCAYNVTLRRVHETIVAV